MPDPAPVPPSPPAPARPGPVTITGNPVLDRLNHERTGLYDQIDAMLSAAATEDRDPSAAELGLIERHRSRITTDLDPQIDLLVSLEEQRAHHRTVITSRPAPATPAPGAPPAAGDAPARVYRTYGQWARDELIRRFDTIRQRAEPGALEAANGRLERAVVNTLSSDVPGLIPPQHISEIMQNISSVRPAVSLARQVPLSSGTLTYPNITSRPVTAKQATEKTEAGNTKMAVAMKSVTAETFLGAGDLSWQAINWSSPDALSLWFDLCAESYAGQTEAAFLAKVTAAATGLAIGGAVGSTPDLAAWMTAIAKAAGLIFDATNYNGNVGRFPNAVVFDAANGFNLFGIVSVANPVFLTVGTANLATGQGPNLGGLRFVISAAATVPIVGYWPAALVGETPGAPVELRAVEPSIGGMEVGVIGAFASEVTEAGAFVKLTAPAGP